MSYIKNPEDSRGVYNSTAFDGTLESDFLEIGKMTDAAKKELINFNADGFDEYKNALLNYLQAVYPTDYTNFVESDLGVMMVELYAYLAATLSFKADMLANESFLSTAQSLSNVRKLLQLIGVDLRGPVSAKATALLNITNSTTVSDSATLKISKSGRTVAVPNTKGGGVLNYSVYKYNTTTGEIDLTEEDIILNKDNSLESGGVSWNNLVLMEGTYKTLTGAFSRDAVTHTIEIQDSNVTEGSITVTDQEGNVYREIRNIYMASGADDSVFHKVYNDDFSAKLTFGNGVRGKRPTPESTYTVQYRVGGGESGNIPTNFIDVILEGTHSTNGSTPLQLRNIKNATGGMGAETIEHAKKWAPNVFRTQYRAVTGQDYTTLANTFAGTQGTNPKSIAVLRRSGAGSNMIDIYCLARATGRHLERASLTFKRELLDYINQFKMLTDEISIVDGLVRTIDLVTTIYVDKRHQDFEGAIKTGVRTVVENYFNPDVREYGELLSVGDLTRAIFDVDYVRFANLDNLEDDVKVAFNEIVQLNNIELTIEYV